MPSKPPAAAKNVENYLEVFDCDFKCLYMTPVHLVVHTPPARLIISRLVRCRNYRPNEWGSCSKEENCRFVHANVDYSTLEAKPIHVNYIWRDENLCIYERLPPGDVLEVYSRNRSKKPDLIPSERILVTRRALLYREDTTQRLSHCVHYYCNGMCNRGENCNFIHAVYVDPNVESDFKRPPAQAMPRVHASVHSSEADISESHAAWGNQLNLVSPSRGCPSSKEDFASQLLLNSQSADFFPLNTEPHEVAALSMDDSQSSNEAAKSVPLNALGESFKKSMDSSVAGNESLTEANASRAEKSVQASAVGTFTPMSQTPMMVPLVLPHDSLGSLPLSVAGSNGISCLAYKAFDASIGQGFLGSSDGLTVSPPTFSQGGGNFSVSIASTPYQMSLSSVHEARLASCHGVIGGTKDADKHSGCMGKPARVYRHNPYKSIEKSRKCLGVGAVEK
ncbi:zinc finger protein family memeber [Trypanosoma conorhini]|uniref:Zinc finger protein family memeber n=1 Tax=Trypanosoma conorhini TaxID=83891 RepID=A0A422NG70_9TRYP|nr:zinc finger protein family memeber [Trypanosoma conorhini]RNF04463.1 zinc finger protein family memeber [Trypanosoma conorhini]